MSETNNNTTTTHKGINLSELSADKLQELYFQVSVQATQTLGIILQEMAIRQQSLHNAKEVASAVAGICGKPPTTTNLNLPKLKRFKEETAAPSEPFIAAKEKFSPYTGSFQTKTY